MLGTALSFVPEGIAQLLDINDSSPCIQIVDLALAGQRPDAGADLDSIFAKIFNVVLHYILITKFTRVSMVGRSLFVINNVRAFDRFSGVPFEDGNDLVVEFQVNNGCTADLLIQSNDLHLGFTGNGLGVAAFSALTLYSRSDHVRVDRYAA
jgi:hypothetical protein